MAGFVFAKNRVIEKQRYYQAHDGVRLWRKPSNARFYLPVYYTMVWGSLAASLYIGGRMVFGHRTWFGEK